MAVEARSRIAPTGLRRTLPNRSLASVPVSRASSSSMLKSEMITSPYPLQGRDVVLDLESRKRYEELRIDIRKLGGRIVDTINEEKLPFVVISDHPTANRLETMKGIYSKNTRIGDLPMLLKEAVRCHVKVRSYTTFQEQFTRFKARIRAAKSLSNAPQKRLPKAEEASKNRKIRRLRRPFIKWQDSKRDHAPSYKECPTPRWTTVYFGPAAGNCVFRRVTAEQLEKRKQRENEAYMDEDSDPPSSPGRERSAKSGKSVKVNRTVKTPTNKFCDLCGKTFEDMEQHYESREHAVTATRPGVYDEVDMCTGAVVDYVICPAAPSSVRLPEVIPEEHEPIFPNDSWDYEYSEGNYECTLLNTRS
ncbi:unnamed protein product [Haemonchus placei]|uniref:DBF4-type domain-containing protein n=1 Tax=Haemonchus placei TaxID=6290 RepID=A0A0N4W1E3_HAEPC|nr:unnamed protein product [Haemonchus placei]